MVSAYGDLTSLRAPGRGLYGSGDVLFKDAIFGRDSAIAAGDLLQMNEDIAREVILTLAALQGVRDAPIGPQSNEEEPGKIHHEHRSLYIGSRRISPASEALLRVLAGQWGGDEESVTYYGSVDATPLFARLVVDYCRVYGDSLLRASYKRRDGRDATVRDALASAVDWITRRMDASDLGLVEFLRRNPDGIPFQVWKDSGTSYVHEDGALANWDAPIAAVEVQAYAYDALLGVGELLGRPDWVERAADLRDRLLEMLWWSDEAFFAMGIDRGPDGRTRPIESRASNAGLVLDSRLFDGLPNAVDYIAPLVRKLCGPDFLTDVGVRCRALSDVALVEFQDYHGTWTVWPRETFAIARGLQRQGLGRLAAQLRSRSLNAVNVAGGNVEFLYVAPDGRVMYDFRESDLRSAAPEVIAGTNRPESPAAWTVSATLALKRWRETRNYKELEDEVVAATPHVDVWRTRGEIEAAYSLRGDFHLDLERGRAMDREARTRVTGGRI